MRKLLATGFTVFLFALCLIPARNIPEVGMPLADKWVHFVLFAVFSILWLRAFPYRGFWHLAVVVMAGVITGWVIEELQGLLVALGRAKEPLDILADAIGTILGAAAFYIWTVLSGFRPRERHP
jgi:VanZ family protein